MDRAKILDAINGLVMVLATGKRNRVWRTFGHFVEEYNRIQGTLCFLVVKYDDHNVEVSIRNLLASLWNEVYDRLDHGTYSRINPDVWRIGLKSDDEYGFVSTA